MYTLVNRDEGSSVYNYIKDLLLKGSLEEKGKWTQAQQDYQRFNLMFGERKGIDYTRIGKLMIRVHRQFSVCLYFCHFFFFFKVLFVKFYSQLDM